MKRYQQFGKKTMALALIVMSMFVVALPAMAELNIPDNTAAKINCSGNVNVRATASTGDSNYQTLGNGSSVTVLSSVTGSNYNGSTAWYKIKCVTKTGGTMTVGATGYVHSSFVEKTTSGGSTTPGGTADKPATTGTRTQGYVATQSGPLNIRASIPTGTVLVAAGKDRTIYYYTTTNSEWYYVEYTHTDGATYKGYASASYIKSGSGSSDPKTKCPVCGTKPNVTSSTSGPGSMVIVQNHPAAPYVPYVHTCDYRAVVTTHTYKCPNFTNGSAHTNVDQRYSTTKTYWCGVITTELN